jgi:hypothetical protein
LFRVTFNGANELWMVKRNSVVKFDLTEAAQPLVISGDGHAIAAFDGKIYIANDNLLRVLDADGTQQASFPLVDQRQHTLVRTRF